MGMVARVVKVPEGRAPAGGSCCARGAVKAGAMVGLWYLRHLWATVGAGRGARAGAAGHDIGVVVDVELLARGAGAGDVLPCVDLDDVLPCACACTHVGRYIDRVLFLDPYP